MSIDLSPALSRAQGVVNGLLLAIPSLAVGLLVFAAFALIGVGVKAAVARLTEARLRTHRNAGQAVGRLAQGLVIFVQSVEGVLSNPAPDVLLMDLAGSAVNLRARWWISPPRRADALDARDRVLSAIKSALTAAGIDLPFPTQQVLFHDQTETTDGDRARQREGWPAGAGPVPGPRRSGEVAPSTASDAKSGRLAQE
jgi:small-conductance mechanosensitive channel